MKILLIAVNAKYIHTNLAVRCLKAYAESQVPVAPEIEIAEYTINQQPRDVLADIWNRHADAAAFSCYIWNITYVERLIRDLKRICPQMHIWAGGPEVSFDADFFLRRMPEVSAVLAGEGEASFAALVRRIAVPGLFQPDSGSFCREELYGGIPGVICRALSSDGADAGTVCGGPASGGPAEPVPLDDIPFVYGLPDFDPELFRHHILYYESSRGCPFHCSYCLSSLTEKVRFRSLSLVLPELQFFLDHRVPQVKFVDRTFNCSHVHTKAIWRYLAEHDNGITNFHFEIEADLLDDEELHLLSALRPGQVQLEIGVQSTNEHTLREIRRSMDLSRLRSVAEQTGKAGNVHRHLDLIAGLPFEDYESFRNSFNDVYAMRPDQLQLGFLKVLKGSHMQKMAESYDLLSQSEGPYEALQTRWLSFGALHGLTDLEEMLEVYGNSGQYRYSVEELCRQFSSPFDLYEALAVYHREAGLLDRKLSRPERFTILRAFFLSIRSERGTADSPDPADLRRFEELLVLDLYLRENSRSRPAWAPDQSAGKEVFRTFYRREAGRNGTPGTDKEEPVSFCLPEEYAGYDARALAHMTHAEMFSTDVLSSGRKPPLYVVFDYLHRDPVTGDARALIIGS